MYGGLALSQNTQTFPGVIPVRYINEPEKTVVVPSTPRPVTEVRYFAPTGVQVVTSSFVATIDLSGLEGKIGIVSVPIEVTTPDTRIRVLSYLPDSPPGELDQPTPRNSPIEVAPGTGPDGLTTGPTTADPPSVTVTGAASLVAEVEAVRADVT